MATLSMKRKMGSFDEDKQMGCNNKKGGRFLNGFQKIVSILWKIRGTIEGNEIIIATNPYEIANYINVRSIGNS